MIKVEENINHKDDGNCKQDNIWWADRAKLEVDGRAKYKICEKNHTRAHHKLIT